MASQQIQGVMGTYLSIGMHSNSRFNVIESKVLGWVFHREIFLRTGSKSGAMSRAVRVTDIRSGILNMVQQESLIRINR
jgi:hypothetical protein